jgi:hypothetical protein
MDFSEEEDFPRSIFMTANNYLELEREKNKMVTSDKMYFSAERELRRSSPLRTLNSAGAVLSGL